MPEEIVLSDVSHAYLLMDIHCGDCGKLCALTNTYEHEHVRYCKSCFDTRVACVKYLTKPAKSPKSLQQLKDELSVQCFSSTKAEATQQGLCIDCKEPALPKCYSAAGTREYYISGLCEVCFDKICGEED